MPNRSALDALAFSSLLAACVGFALCLAVGRTLEAPGRFRCALLVGLGTFIIYTLDRLRDTRRDRSTSPTRTEFVERHRGTLTFALAASAILFGGLLFSASPEIIVLVAGIGGVGLFHRRLKAGASRKAVYVSLAWLLACLGIPWLDAGRPDIGAAIAGILFPTLLANLIASNLRDDEHETFRARPANLLALSRGATLLGIGVAFFSGRALQPLAWIPFAEWIALLGFRQDERYGHLVIDGALLVGSLIALTHLELAPT